MTAEDEYAEGRRILERLIREEVPSPLRQSDCESLADAVTPAVSARIRALPPEQRKQVIAELTRLSIAEVVEEIEAEVREES